MVWNGAVHECERADGLARSLQLVKAKLGMMFIDKLLEIHMKNKNLFVVFRCMSCECEIRAKFVALKLEAPKRCWTTKICPNCKAENEVMLKMEVRLTDEM